MVNQLIESPLQMGNRRVMLRNTLYTNLNSLYHFYILPIVEINFVPQFNKKFKTIRVLYVNDMSMIVVAINTYLTGWGNWKTLKKIVLGRIGETFCSATISH